MWGPQPPAASPPKFLSAGGWGGGVGQASRLQFSSCGEPTRRLQLPLFIWPHGEPGFRGPSPSCVNWSSLYPQTSRPLLQVAAFSFLPPHKPLSPKCSHLVLAPPPGYHKDPPRPRPRSLPNLCPPLPAGRRPAPGRVSPVGTVCLENRNPGRGLGGAPLPHRSLLPAPPGFLCPTPGWAGGRGVSVMGGEDRWFSSPLPCPVRPDLPSPTLGAARGAAPPPAALVSRAARQGRG